MAETYKKIDEDTLEITYKHTVEKEHLLEEKKMHEQDIVRANEEITRIDAKLTILTK